MLCATKQPSMNFDVLQTVTRMVTAIFIFILSAAILSGIIMSLVMVLGFNNPEREKLSAYECGFEPFGDARDTFDIQFYLVGLLFLIFDIEIAFLFPWSVLVVMGSKALLWLILSFSLILIVGFILEMKMGVLDWKAKSVPGNQGKHQQTNDKFICFEHPWCRKSVSYFWSNVHVSDWSDGAVIPNRLVNELHFIDIFTEFEVVGQLCSGLVHPSILILSLNLQV